MEDRLTSVENLKAQINSMYRDVLYKYQEMYTAQKDIAEYAIRAVQEHLAVVEGSQS